MLAKDLKTGNIFRIRRTERVAVRDWWNRGYLGKEKEAPDGPWLVTGIVGETIRVRHLENGYQADYTTDSRVGTQTYVVVTNLVMCAECDKREVADNNDYLCKRCRKRLSR